MGGRTGRQHLGRAGVSIGEAEGESSTYVRTVLLMDGAWGQQGRVDVLVRGGHGGMVVVVGEGVMPPG